MGATPFRFLFISLIDDYAKDNSGELFTKMHCILMTKLELFYRDLINEQICILVECSLLPASS